MLGWWWAGIGGWTYKDYQSKSVETTGERASVPTYLLKGLDSENCKKFGLIYGETTIPGEILIAVFEDSTYLPINLGILEIVFPYRFVNDELFLDLLNLKTNKLNNYQLYYPEHTLYSKLDFSSLINQEIVRVEQWKVELYLSKSEYYFQTAELIMEYD